MTPSGLHVEAVADEASVPTVGMFTRRPLLFKQPAAFSLATGAAAASPTATVEQEYGGRKRSQEVRAAAQRPLSNTLASRSECLSGSKHLVCVSSVCEVNTHDYARVRFASAPVSSHQRGYTECKSATFVYLCVRLCVPSVCVCMCVRVHLSEL